MNIITLHDPSQFWIEAYVDEGQIRHVRVGKQELIDLENKYAFSESIATYLISKGSTIVPVFSGK